MIGNPVKLPIRSSQGNLFKREGHILIKRSKGDFVWRYIVMDGTELFCYTNDKKVRVKFFHSLATDVDFFIPPPEEEQKEANAPLALQLKIGMRYCRELYFSSEEDREYWHSIF